MDNREEEEIRNALNDSMDDMQFEEIPEIATSPINEPVKTGEVSTSSVDLSNATISSRQAVEEPLIDSEQENDIQFEDIPDEALYEEQLVDEDLDAPEQEIDGDEVNEKESGGAGSELELPNHHAAMAADSLIGVADNALELGGNFFVKIKKSKEVMQFKEARKIIDKQNQKNIDRLKLDEEDKTLLKPILMEILKKRAKELTPEQQLMALGISILTKKVQLAVEMRSEGKTIAANVQAAVRKEIEAMEARQAKKEEEQVEEIEVEDYDEAA